MGVAATTLAPADIARLTPGARAGEFGYGYFLPEQGAVDVDHAMSLVLEGCGSRQVEFTTSPVEELVILDGVCRGVQTGNRLIPADTVVLAAGAHNTHLAKMAGGKVPLDIVSGTLAHSEPMPPILNRVLNGPLGSIKQNPDGRIVTGLDYAPGADGTDTSAEYGRQLLANAAQVVPQLGSARLERMTVGHVPIPENDMMPIVGHLRTTPNVYVSSMMSGVTMAPLMGRLAAFEIVSGTRLGVLSPFRPERFENT